MGYHELSARPSRPFVELDGQVYDLDAFGMDDGKSENGDDTFRFLFELGLGYATYLYVIVAGGQGRERRRLFSPHFWLKGFVTVDMEPSERPTPKRVVAAKTRLPLVYSTVTVGEHRQRIAAQHFEAASADELKMQFELEPSSQLLWTPRSSWELDGRPIPSAESLSFDLPAEG